MVYETRWEEAGRFKRESPNGWIIHTFIVSPPNERVNWERTNIQVAKALNGSHVIDVGDDEPLMLAYTKQINSDASISFIGNAIKYCIRN
jgi:hypothetical protein